MNIFFIPSWYATSLDPLAGIFSIDQVTLMIKHFPDLRYGISVWGQSDGRLFLDTDFLPREGLMKLHKIYPHIKGIVTDRIIEFFQPTYSCSINKNNGNIDNVIASNIINFENYLSLCKQVDIIHAHVGFPGGYVARKISECFNVPYIITEHMSPFPHKVFLDRENNLHPFLKEAYMHSKANIAVSSWLKKEMKKKECYNLQVIHNPVDEDVFKPNSELIRTEIFTFFSLGRMDEGKGFDILLKAFSRLSGKVNLRIGGGGNDVLLEELKQLSIELNISDKVTWLGELDRETALKEYQNCNAFVLPSRLESMGIVYVEAMACGKPIIATRCGGPEDLVNEICGYLVENEDMEGLANMMDKMIMNYNSFSSEKIRENFEKKFSAKVICHQIMSVYMEAIKKTEVENEKRTKY